MSTHRHTFMPTNRQVLGLLKVPTLNVNKTIGIKRYLYFLLNMSVPIAPTIIKNSGPNEYIIDPDKKLISLPVILVTINITIFVTMNIKPMIIKISKNDFHFGYFKFLLS